MTSCSVVMSAAFLEISSNFLALMPSAWRNGMGSRSAMGASDTQRTMRLLRGHEAKETADDDGGSVLEGAVVERLWARKGGWALVVMDERGGALGLDLWRGTERARPGAHRAGRVGSRGRVN